MSRGVRSYVPVSESSIEGEGWSCFSSTSETETETEAVSAPSDHTICFWKAFVLGRGNEVPVLDVCFRSCRRLSAVEAVSFQRLAVSSVSTSGSTLPLH